MTRVKICGITNLKDALAAVRLGADELGFNFFAGSHRYIPPNAAPNIIAEVKGRIATTGVFVNETIENIETIADATGIGTVQLHGDETPEFVDTLRGRTGLSIIKAFRMSSGFVTESIGDYNVDAVLLDGYSVGERGGTGETCDWGAAKGATRIAERVYLAGGLTPENVSEAIEAVRPYAVDVCSGVEAAKGVKDHEKLRLFIERAKENG